MDIIDAWLDYGLPAISRWIDHVGKRVAALIEDHDEFARVEIIFALTSILNRTAQVYLGTDRPLGAYDQMRPWLGHVAGIPPWEAEALWTGVRNHVIHLGALNPLASFRAKSSGRRTYVIVEATARPEIDPAPAFGTYTTREPSSSEAQGEFRGRGLGFASMTTFADGSPQFRGCMSGEQVVAVLFYLDELVENARQALRATVEHVRNNGEGLRSGLELLHEKVWFELPAEEAAELGLGVPHPGHPWYMQRLKLPGS